MKNAKRNWPLAMHSMKHDEWEKKEFFILPMTLNGTLANSSIWF